VRDVVPEEEFLMMAQSAPDGGAGGG
jgi:hypothetical protein